MDPRRGGLRLMVGLLRSVVVAAIALLCASSADAYPQFQFSTYNSRCQNCHYSPSGGGLINDYGRSESADTISRGGDGGLLHGLWTAPDWVQFGADFRVAALGKQVGDDPRFVVFPMQGDTYVRFAFGDFSTYFSFGPRAAARDPKQSALRRMVSREHFVTWQPDTSGIYLRAGRFAAPFGLRLQDHTVYTRKYTGFHVMEETYNMSGGWFAPTWEIHATAFAPADEFTSSGPRESGGVVYGEKMLGDGTGAVGGQFRAGFANGSNRYTAGAIGKWYWDGPKLLAQGELDLIVQDFEASGSPTRGQLASYLGLSYWPATGFMFTGAFERFDQDLSIGKSYRDAYRLEFQWFPMAHVELHVLTKMEFQGDYGEPTYLGLLMGHYYL